MPEPIVDPRMVEEELTRVLRSREFHDSGRMCRFLRFVVDATLSGKADELKEYSIAVGVFDREPDFDPRTDPVVRSEARRLRSKLASYYATEGMQDDLAIELPKGGYVPEFRQRSVTTVILPDPEAGRTTTELPGRRETGKKISRPYALLGVVAALAVVVTTFPLVHGRWGGMHSQPVESLAVLPFQNLTDDRRIDYLADGIADEVLDSLAYIPDLKVVARTSAAQFKGRSLSTQEIGQRLGVRVFLEGSIQSSAGTLRVMTRLVNAETGYQIWSHGYEFQTKDAFRVQDAIARAVAQQVGRAANISGRHMFAVNEEAYKDYLLARHHIAEESNAPAASLFEAKRLLEQAVALDPKSGDSWATLAGVYGMLAMTGAVPLTQGLQTAVDYGHKALDLDPNSADAVAEEAIAVAHLQHDWPRADQLFRRAIAIKPSDALTHGQYAWSVLWPTDRLEEAEQEQKRAIELDPLNADSRVGLANTLYFQHQYEAAVRAGMEALHLSPNSEHVARNLLRPLVMTGRAGDITRLMQRFWVGEPDHSFVLTMKLQATGDKAAARVQARRTLEREKNLVHRALLYAVLDQEDQIINTFEHAAVPEEMWAIDGAVLDPVFDRYRSSAPFQNMMKKLVAAR